MKSIHQLLGRKLRLGVVGGGTGSFVGPIHRIAARMSDCYDLEAAVLSSNPSYSKKQASALGLDEQRAYCDWKEMLECEKKREDPIDVLAIMTPNNTHFPIAMSFLKAGFHIICDKPLCNELHEAEKLSKAVEESSQVFCVTYNYSAYPMVRQARAMVQNGIIGEIRQVHLTYIQGYLATFEEEENSAWRFKPQIAGPSLVLGDIGSHAFHLGEYVAGEKVKQLFADVDAITPKRTAHDYVTCLLKFENQAKGTMLVTNAAAGAEHGLSFRIFGSKGGLEWHQERPNELRHRQLNGFEQIMTRRKDGMLRPEAEQCTTLRFGHPEGYHDAFANLYKEVAYTIAARKLGFDDSQSNIFPNIQDGMRGIQFIYACLESCKENAWVKL